MKIDLSPQFQKGLPVLLKLQEHDYEAYFVGGSVRDSILGREVHDVDITTSATPEEMKEIFTVAPNYSGEKHGTELVFLNDDHYEVTTFRIDGEYLDGRHPKEVIFTRNLKEDLSRRDFKINAFAMSAEGQIVDYFDGLDDLKNHTISAVGNPVERFSEDALRILRAYRFATTLDFEIEEQTLKATREIASNLENIAVERKFEEFNKLLASPNAGKHISEMQANGVMQYLPGYEFIKSENISDYQHANPTSDFEGWISFINQLEVSDLDAFMNAWKMSNKLKRALKKSMNFINAAQKTNMLLFDTGREVLVSTLNVVEIPNADELIQRYDQLQIKSADELAVDGQDLKAMGIAPGPIYTEILSGLVEKVVAGTLQNDKTILEEEIKKP